MILTNNMASRLNRMVLLTVYVCIPMATLADIFIFNKRLQIEDQYSDLAITIGIILSLAAVTMGLIRASGIFGINRHPKLNISIIVLISLIGNMTLSQTIDISWALFCLIGFAVVFRFGWKFGLGYWFLMLAYEAAYLYFGGLSQVEDRLLPTNILIFPLILAATLLSAFIFTQSISNHYQRVAEATEKFNREHNKVSSLINGLSDAIVSTNEDLSITMYNSAFLGLINANIVTQGSSLPALLRLTDEYGENIDLAAYVDQNGPDIDSDNLTLSVGEESMNLHLSVSPVLDNESNVTGYTVMLRDITKQKSLEQEKDEFISVVSHELRTPVAVAEGGVSNAKVIAQKQIPSGETKDMIIKMVDMAHDEIVALAGMVNDLSALSRAERDDMLKDTEQINVHQFLTDAHEIYKKPAQRKGLELNLDLSLMPKDQTLGTVKLYLAEIIQNFVTNSIKYTKEGSVTMTASMADGGKSVEFSVSDTGIGISNRDQEFIFDKFFRSEDYRTRESSGTGLGLYVTKKLTHIIGGQLGVTSKLNQGTTMYIKLPVGKGQKSDASS